MKKFGTKSFKACVCGKKSCDVCTTTILDNATKLIFHTTNKKKTYTLKPTEKQLKSMKIFWAMLKKEQDKFYKETSLLETAMSDAVGIEGLEFFLSDDGYYCGIGNIDRTMALIHEFELEK